MNIVEVQKLIHSVGVKGAPTLGAGGCWFLNVGYPPLIRLGVAEQEIRTSLESVPKVREAEEKFARSFSF